MYLSRKYKYYGGVISDRGKYGSIPRPTFSRSYLTLRLFTFSIISIVVQIHINESFALYSYLQNKIGGGQLY